MTTDNDATTTGSAAAASRAIGAMFFSCFGGAWLVLGVLSIYGIRLAALLPVAAGTALIFFAALQQFRRNRIAHAAEADTPESKRTDRIFNIVNAIQWTLVFIVATALSKFGHKEWTIPSIIFIVGVHFFPLAAAFKVTRHYVTGAALVVLAIGYPLLSADGPGSPVGCLGAGVILWASAVAALERPAKK